MADQFMGADRKAFEIGYEPLRRLGQYLARRRDFPELLELHKHTNGRVGAFLAGRRIRPAVLAECCIDMSAFHWFAGGVWISKDTDEAVMFERMKLDYQMIVQPPRGGERTPST